MSSETNPTNESDTNNSVEVPPAVPEQTPEVFPVVSDDVHLTRDYFEGGNG